MPGIFIGLIILLVIAFAVISAIQARKRRAELEAWVAAHNLRLDEAEDRNFESRFSQFACLRQGSNRYAYNLITGTWDGREITAFDYHYETHSQDAKGNQQTHDHHFSGVILRSEVPLKPLMIRAESIFDKVAGAFGFDDIDFESAEFSRRFYVRAPNRRWAYDVLHPRAMQLLLDSPRFSIEFDPLHVIAWRTGTFNIPDREAAITLIDGLLDQLPSYVREQQQSGQKE